MKTKLLPVLLLSLMLAACGTQRKIQAQVYVSVYARIPLAPHIVLSVDVPVIGAPSPDYIWIDGYWTWNHYDRAYVWVQGYWTLAPYVGAYWIPGYWEHYRSGYRWIDACWLPRNHYLHYGYFDGRFDYYGRPVYYHRPMTNHNHGYVYAYDHNPNHRAKGYNSSSYYNEAPQRERERIDRQYANSRSASANNDRRNITNSRAENSRSSVATQNRSGNRTETVDATRGNRTETIRPKTENNPVRSENATPARRDNTQSVRSSSRNERTSTQTRSSNNRESGNTREAGRSDNSRRR